MTQFTVILIHQNKPQTAVIFEIF